VCVYVVLFLILGAFDIVAAVILIGTHIWSVQRHCHKCVRDSGVRRQRGPCARHRFTGDVHVSPAFYHHFYHVAGHAKEP